MPKLHGGPGQRLLWPSVATSVPLARCSVEAQLLFDRLISQADDQGRLQGEPILVRAACMPLVKTATSKKIERWIEELVEAELIIWYQARKEWLIQIRNWWDHQGGQRWIYPSRWPAPKDWDDREPKTPQPITEVLAGAASRRNSAGIMPASRPNGAGVIPDVGGGGGDGGGGGVSGAGRTPAREPVILTDDQRAESIRRNQELVDNPDTPDVVRKAAQKTIDRLSAATSGAAPAEAAHGG